ncbi:MAG: hypothetical protein LBP26_03090 [Clostridiales bacterium]|jgi:heme O synthase-like polyprenyltransferase|nr:hypothetical protein [Clostridiales bacterium]
MKTGLRLIGGGVITLSAALLFLSVFFAGNRLLYGAFAFVAGGIATVFAIPLIDNPTKKRCGDVAKIQSVILITRILFFLASVALVTAGVNFLFYLIVIFLQAAAEVLNGVKIYKVYSRQEDVDADKNLFAESLSPRLYL